MVSATLIGNCDLYLTFCFLVSNLTVTVVLFGQEKGFLRVLSPSFR